MNRGVQAQVFLIVLNHVQQLDNQTRLQKIKNLPSMKQTAITIQERKSDLLQKSWISSDLSVY